MVSHTLTCDEKNKRVTNANNPGFAAQRHAPRTGSHRKKGSHHPICMSPSVSKTTS